MLKKKSAPTRNTRKLRKPTTKQFVEWLSECANHLAKAKQWPIATTRFTYFDCALCWPAKPPDIESSDVEYYQAMREKQHEKALIEFESAYKMAYEGGDLEAIMEFAKENREALRSEWVIRQLVEWRLSGSKEGRQQFNRFIGHYWNDKGKRTHAKMLEIIKKDQAVYRDSLTWTKRPKISGLAQQHTIGQNDVKDILKAYTRAYEMWCLYLSLMPSR